MFRSAGQLSYDDAQAVIEGKELDAAKIFSPHSPSAVEEDIRVMHVSQRDPLGMSVSFTLMPSALRSNLRPVASKVGL